MGWAVAHCWLVWLRCRWSLGSGHLDGECCRACCNCIPFLKLPSWLLLRLLLLSSISTSPAIDAFSQVDEGVILLKGWPAGGSCCAAFVCFVSRCRWHCFAVDSALAAQLVSAATCALARLAAVIGVGVAGAADCLACRR